MITYTHPVAGNLPIKTLVAKVIADKYTHTHRHTHTPMNVTLMVYM